jgi:hypothetical protein
MKKKKKRENRWGLRTWEGAGPPLPVGRSNAPVARLVLPEKGQQCHTRIQLISRDFFAVESFRNTKYLKKTYGFSPDKKNPRYAMNQEETSKYHMKKIKYRAA